MLFPLDSIPDGPRLETKRALLLLDFQNDFVSPQGLLPVPNALSFLPKLPNLVKGFRERDEVVWVRTEYRQSRPSLSTDSGSYAILLKQFVDRVDDSVGLRTTNGDDAPGSNEADGVHDTTQPEPALHPDTEAFLAPELPDPSQRCCLPMTSGAQYPTKLSECIDGTRDLNVVKSHYSAFADMSLLLQLRTRLVTHLYVCGTLSNVGVYATVVDAVRQGFNVTLIEDCLGFRNETCHIESMKQMADNLGADGIDYQELMDDLAGMLGDVIQESDFATKFEVSVQAPQPPKEGISHSQKINDWMASMDKEANNFQIPEESLRRSPKTHEYEAGVEANANDGESPNCIKRERVSPDPSSPRKRSTSDKEGLEDIREDKSVDKRSARRASYDTYSSVSATSAKKRRPRRVIKSMTPEGPDELKHKPSSSLKALGESLSTGDLPDHLTGGDIHMAAPVSSSPPLKRTNIPEDNATGRRKKPKNTPLTFLGPNDSLGDGDSSVVHDVLTSSEANQAFTDLRDKVKWQKMYHRTGEVPRLVAVQGQKPSGSNVVPIYRHPADESPELLPFNEDVETLRIACEKIVRHPLNHVLIQYYRGGEDNISEHSDKTLDIVHGSSIVNLSLGAMRTMTLRTKKTPSESESVLLPAHLSAPAPSKPPARSVQRIRLPHNSLFVLGQATNANWLHAIRADKRPTCEKSPEELAYDGERISLTFRHIGTFIDTERGFIWGQGARGKTEQDARKILTPGTITAVREGEEMIIAFGRENHDDGETFNWEEWYGDGFDVVNFVITKPV